MKEKPSDIVSAETALAKIFGLVKTNASYDPTDLNHAQTPQQLGELLLLNVGGSPPFTALEIDSAIAANDAFVEALERIVSHARDISSRNLQQKDKQ